jgi:hypothetical protein
MCLLTGKPGTIPSCKTWKTWELLENPVALVRNIQQDDQHVHPASVCTPYLVGGFQHVFHHIIRIYIYIIIYIYPYIIHYWLVVWNIIFICFPSIVNFIIPGDERIFSEGVFNQKPDITFQNKLFQWGCQDTTGGTTPLLTRMHFQVYSNTHILPTKAAVNCFLFIMEPAC